MFRNFFQAKARLIYFLPSFFLLLTFFLGSCTSQNEEGGDRADNDAAGKPGELTVTSTAMNFMAPDTIYAGWNEIIYNNESKDTHFLILEKYPEGKNVDSGKARIIPVFQQAMDSIRLAGLDAGLKEFANLPPWFPEVKYLGGTGLVSPGNTATTIVNISPGLYVIECYVKMNNGIFHSAMGMIGQVIVKPGDNDRKPPTADVSVSIDTAGGIAISGQPVKGEQTFGVHFTSQKVYENFVGHDVHLVKLADTANVATLEAWMNWMDPGEFISPSPTGFTFLGGTQEMPAGDSAFFTVNVSPGKYALISEVPGASGKKLLQTFRVAE